MASSSRLTVPIIASLVAFLLLFASIAPCSLASQPQNSTTTIFKLNNRIRAHLKKINKPSLKTIHSPDGDTIDCVPSHLQPAFDHPQLKGQRPLDPPERPKGHEEPMGEEIVENLQLWASSGEFCPEGTVPIRRTNEQDMMRASSVGRFGRRPAKGVRRDSAGSGHEVWVISGSFGRDLNTIEAGWQVSPQLYGDNLPRFFTYWTSDAYRATGCYNLLCSGFVQTNNKIAIGAAISPRSAYNSGQFDISLLIWKDPKHGHWWLEFGSGLLVGYWPSFLFNHLTRHASMVQFGGEVVNSRPYGFHTSTQMGSGHFANEGFRRAAYFRNLQVVDWDNNLIPTSNLRLTADHSSCYSIQGGVNRVWGNYFYYGGPGRCMRCP